MPKTSELRIISGRFKGAKINSPHSADTHPMGAREKLALFNMIDAHDCRVLDLYAGSGALGLEALSRSATEVVFVDNSATAISAIRNNLKQLSANMTFANQSLVQVVRTKVSNFLQKLSDFAEYFDIIIADPPYDHFLPEDLAAVADLLKPTGVFVLSSPARLSEPTFAHLESISSRTYAAARLTIYRKIDNSVL